MFAFNPEPLAGPVAELESWRRQLDLRTLARSWEGRLRRDLEASAVAGSTGLEGVPVTADEVRRILAGDRPATVSPGNADLVRGYRDAMTFVLHRADDPAFQWSRELIVGLQHRILAGKYELGAGRLRQGQVDIVNSRTGARVFVPAPPDRVAALVDRALHEVATADWHPAVKAGWIHVALAAIHPFRDGNGRTARVGASLAMFRGGFRRPEFCSLEEWWGTHPAEYYSAFNCLGAEFDEGADVTEFLSAHVAAQVSQVQALHREEQIGRILWIALENLCADVRLPSRLANALYDAFHEREVTAPYYRELADVSAATATSDLQAALAAELLAPVGERRWRKYRVGPRLYERVRDVLGLSVSPPEPATRFSIVNDIARGLRATHGIAEEATLRIQEVSPSTCVVAWAPPTEIVSVTRGIATTSRSRTH